MAKGQAPYFNPMQPLVTNQQLLNPEFWRQFFENLTAESFSVIDLATDVAGALPVANGGTGATIANTAFGNLSPMTTRGDLISRSGTGPIRVPIGAATRVLTSDGVDASWQPPATSGTVTGPGVSVDSEIALFNGTTGAVLKRATGTGAVMATAGVFSVLTASGTWTPTLTNTTNLDASTPFLSQWSRSGSVVTFSGRVDLDPTAAASTVLGMSLPIASAFASDLQAGGTFANRAVQESGAIFADVANARLTLQFLAVSTTTQVFNFTGSYLVV